MGILKKIQGQRKIIITTNILSRALNQNVDLVINFNPPLLNGTFDSKIYCYRTGCATRFGTKSGKVLTFIDHSEEEILERALRYDLNVTAAELTLPQL